MKIIELQQGSAEWLAHRAQHFNASDCPAMLAASPYKTRSQLIHELATGITPEVDPGLQRRYADGHRSEALARPLAEQIVGEDLYPVTGTEGKLSASFDGLTMGEDVAFEHKSLNDSLRYTPWDEGNGDHLPLHYRAQMEQQLMVSGAERVLFMATKWEGDTLVEKRHCWYASDSALRARIVAGWEQFEADVAAYVPTETALAPVAAAVTALPAVSVQVSGSIVVRDNFKAFEVAARDFIENKLIRKPESDQDFADLALQIKALEKAEEALGAAEAQMLAQVDAVDIAKRTKDMLLKLVRDNRLMAEKLLASRKEQIKVEQVQRGQAALTEYVAALNTRIGKPYMPIITADFAGAIKGKRTVESLKGAVDDLLASKKIEASATADRIQINLRHLAEHAAEHAALFPDVAAIALKAADDFAAVVQFRVADQRAKMQKAADELAEQARARIRQEEADRADREARATAETERLARAAATPPPAPAPAPAPALAVAAAPIAPAPAAAAPTVYQMAARAQPAATPAAEDGPANLLIGGINRRLGFDVSAVFLKQIGFEPARIDGARRFYRDSDLPRIGQAIAAHTIRVTQLQAVAA